MSKHPGFLSTSPSSSTELRMMLVLMRVGTLMFSSPFSTIFPVFINSMVLVARLFWFEIKLSFCFECNWNIVSC